MDRNDFVCVYSGGETATTTNKHNTRSLPKAVTITKHSGTMGERKGKASLWQHPLIDSATAV